MHRRHLLGLSLGSAIVAALPPMADADAITKLDADQCLGLTVMHGSDSVGYGGIVNASTSYALQRGWYMPPDPPSDYGLRLHADGRPYYLCTILKITPAGLAHGEEIVRQWEVDETHPFHKSALRELDRRNNPERELIKRMEDCLAFAVPYSVASTEVVAISWIGEAPSSAAQRMLDLGYITTHVGEKNWRHGCITPLGVERGCEIIQQRA